MEPSIHKIILATDFSKASERASYYAALLAQSFNAELHALHVFNPRSIGAVYKLAQITDQEKEDLVLTRERGEEMLNELADSFHVKTHTIFTEGYASTEIIRITKKEHADLLVLGTHGYTGWNRLALGSVAEHIVRHSPCPVLTIKPTEHNL